MILWFPQSPFSTLTRSHVPPHICAELCTPCTAEPFTAQSCLLLRHSLSLWKWCVSAWGGVWEISPPDLTQTCTPKSRDPTDRWIISAWIIFCSCQACEREGVEITFQILFLPSPLLPPLGSYISLSSMHRFNKPIFLINEIIHL